MSLLLAEGNPTHRHFARALLDQHFPEHGPVLEVADGASAVQRALTERPGLVVICARIPWVPLDSMPLGCNGHALLFAHLAAIEDIKRLGRQPL